MIKTTSLNFLLLTGVGARIRLRSGVRGAHVVVPLRRDAVVTHGRGSKMRNRHLRRIKEVGRAQWRRESGQHQQAWAENCIGRFKRILGPQLRARCRDGQRVEALMGCVVLNRMLELGAPKSAPMIT